MDRAFPTFVFDVGRGLETLDAARYFGRVPAWQEALAERVSASQAAGGSVNADGYPRGRRLACQAMVWSRGTNGIGQCARAQRNRGMR